MWTKPASEVSTAAAIPALRHLSLQPSFDLTHNQLDPNKPTEMQSKHTETRHSNRYVGTVVDLVNQVSGI